MAKTKDFVVGTIVKLKSGGPEMTVKQEILNMSDRPTGNYKCQWFAGKKLEDGVFPGDSLDLVKPNSDAER